MEIALIITRDVDELAINTIIKPLLSRVILNRLSDGLVTY
jgi:hypothetical protein